MSGHYTELRDLLKTFDGDLESTGQGWADAGAELCEKEIIEFDENDWDTLYKNRRDLTNGERHELAYLLDVAPQERVIPFLIWLVSEAQGEGWVLAIEQLSRLYNSNAAIFDTSNHREFIPKMLNNFKIEIEKFYNFPISEGVQFNDYFYKHSHLIGEEVSQFYEYLSKNT